MLKAYNHLWVSKVLSLCSSYEAAFVGNTSETLVSAWPSLSPFSKAWQEPSFCGRLRHEGYTHNSCRQGNKVIVPMTTVSNTAIDLGSSFIANDICVCLLVLSDQQDINVVRCRCCDWIFDRQVSSSSVICESYVEVYMKAMLIIRANAAPFAFSNSLITSNAFASCLTESHSSSWESHPFHRTKY